MYFSRSTNYYNEFRLTSSVIAFLSSSSSILNSSLIIFSSVRNEPLEILLCMYRANYFCCHIHVDIVYFCHYNLSIFILLAPAIEVRLTLQIIIIVITIIVLAIISLVLLRVTMKKQQLKSKLLHYCIYCLPYRLISLSDIPNMHQLLVRIAPIQLCWH